MRRLSDIKGEEALDVLAELIEPVVEIMGDAECKNKFNTSSRIDFVKYIIKEHKKPLLKVMAILEGVEPKDYEPNLLTLPAMLLDMMNDEELVKLFTSAPSMEEANA